LKINLFVRPLIYGTIRASRVIYSKDASWGARIWVWGKKLWIKRSEVGASVVVPYLSFVQTR